MILRGEYNVNTDEDRIKLIADIVEESSKDPDIRELSLGILRKAGVQEKDTHGEIKTIFNWVKRNIQYRGDVFCRDSYHTANRIIKLRAGDCDDMSILLDSMLASVGIPIGARIMSSRMNKPFHHIYALAGVRTRQGMQWIPLDATNKSYNAGDEPKWAKKKDFLFVCGE
ncbi:MAG TPA: transglutaminase domain-containing protein [Candidatus Pacearchaeota archaeon]|nr:transglutaminase domain-containing protein [Candidatus Pacearchaeota archaeon]